MAVGSYPIAVNPVTGALTYGDVTAPDSPPSLPADHGLIAWTQPLSTMSSATALTTAGTVYLRRLRRVPACSVTSIIISVATAGVTLTSGQCFTALYTSAGVLVGVSADQAAAWGTAGVKTAALVGGPFTLTAGDYYVAAWFNGTTGPALIRAGSAIAAAANFGLAAPNLVTCSSSTSITTTAPNPFGAQTSYTLEWWAGLS